MIGFDPDLSAPPELHSTVLCGGLPNALLKGGIKGRIRIEANRTRDVQYGVAPAVEPGQQLPGMFDPVPIQVIEETHAESGIDDLR